jgi:hypothetical protein
MNRGNKKIEREGKGGCRTIMATKLYTYIRELGKLFSLLYVQLVLKFNVYKIKIMLRQLFIIFHLLFNHGYGYILENIMVTYNMVLSYVSLTD